MHKELLNIVCKNNVANVICICRDAGEYIEQHDKHAWHVLSVCTYMIMQCIYMQSCIMLHVLDLRTQHASHIVDRSCIAAICMHACTVQRRLVEQRTIFNLHANQNCQVLALISFYNLINWLPCMCMCNAISQTMMMHGCLKTAW